MLGQTNIITDKGIKQAKDLKLTDYVLDSDSNTYLPKVIKTVDAISDIYELTLSDGRVVQLDAIQKLPLYNTEETIAVEDLYLSSALVGFEHQYQLAKVTAVTPKDFVATLQELKKYSYTPTINVSNSNPKSIQIKVVMGLIYSFDDINTRNTFLNSIWGAGYHATIDPSETMAKDTKCIFTFYPSSVIESYLIGNTGYDELALLADVIRQQQANVPSQVYVKSVELKQNISAISVHISADTNTLLTSNYIPLAVEGE